MQSTYHIRIKKDYAASVIEDLLKMKAIEFLNSNEVIIPEWQKDVVSKCVIEVNENPSILIDEEVVFKMLIID